MSESPDSATKLSQIGERLDAILEDARGAFSRHTVRALKADLYAFASWCAERGLSPLPALARTVAAYVEAMAAVRAPATVRRYVFSIVTVHRAAGEQGPLEHPEVQRALQRMRQRNGCRQRQVQGLTWKLLRRLMEAWNEELRGRVRADEPRKDGASGDLGFREDQVSEDISRPQRPNSSPNSWDSEVRRSALTTAVPACPTLQTHHWLPVVDVLTDPPC